MFDIYLRVEGDWVGGCSGGVSETETVALLFLTLSCFVVLKPIKHILAFDLAVVAELGGDVLDLLRIGSPHSSPIKRLQYPNLFLRGIPPRTPGVRLHLVLHR